MRKFQQYITEGVYDPAIFKAFFLAGGPGSGKSWVSARALSLSLIHISEPTRPY